MSEHNCHSCVASVERVTVHSIDGVHTHPIPVKSTDNSREFLSLSSSIAKSLVRQISPDLNCEDRGELKLSVVFFFFFVDAYINKVRQPVWRIRSFSLLHRYASTLLQSAIAIVLCQSFM